MSDLVNYEQHDAVAVVTINRPDKMNAFTSEVSQQMQLALERAHHDDSVRVIVLTGAGRCFSAGADLSGGPPTKPYHYSGDFPDISRTRGVYKPIVAALHGHVVGYGMWIALDSDIRVATADTSFWLPEPQWGIATIPAAWFPKIMPWAIASELLLLAERVSAQRAYDVGMINKIVPSDHLMAEAEKIAERFCELSPVAVQGMKESMIRASSLDYAAVDHITDFVQTRVMNSEDRKEGSKAFLEKRSVEWPNK